MKEVLAFFSQLDMLKGWEPVRLIGCGSNGKVYHIRHTATGSEAALKWSHIDRSEDGVLSRFSFEKAQAMLLDEIATLKKLNTIPEVVGIQDSRCISPDGSSMDTFIRMELLEPLLTRLRDKAITIGQTEHLVADVSKALSICHAEKIIHGDIKPENILCSKDYFKLGDFGLALDMLRHNGRDPQGTPYFQPPEYREGQPASVQGDLYSFGMTLYVIFNNGMLPFQQKPGRQEEQKAWQRCCEHVKDISASYPRPLHATDEIAAVIDRAVKVDPTQRYQTAQELAEDYRAAIASLSVTQKTVVLPYNVTTEELPQEEKVYLSTGRATYGSSTGEPEAAPQKETAAGGSGFVIPGANEEKKTEKPVVQAVSEPKAKRLPIAAIIAGALLVLAVIVLLVLQGTKPPALLYQAESGVFGARITLSNTAEGTPLRVTTRTAGLPAGTQADFSAPEIVLEGLAPATDYEIDVENANQRVTIALRTKNAADGAFQPVKQRIFTCKANLLLENGAAALEGTSHLTELESPVLALRNAPLAEQNLAVLFSCLAQTQQLEYPQKTTMHIVLRVPGSEAIVQQKVIPPLTLTDASFRCLEDISPLLDAYHAAHGTLPQGQVRLEIYWLDELIGSAELVLNTAGGA